MPKRWTILPQDRGTVESILYHANQAGCPVSYLTASLLAVRGIVQPDDIVCFLRPSLNQLHPPEHLPGCVETARVLAQSIREHKKIAVYGDYDVDGITATVLLRNVIVALGGDVCYHVPSRLDEGYGLHRDALQFLRTEKNVDVVITVDCGINSTAEATFAKSIGLTLLITDHHTPGAELPEAIAIAHPMLAHSSSEEMAVPHSSVEIPTADTPHERLYPFPELCGAGVALKVAWATCQAMSGTVKVPENLKTVLIESVGLAALGTISDMVPLKGENRILVDFGVHKSLRENPSQGITELMKVITKKESTNKESRQIDTEMIAWQIAPRLNAAGRLGQAELAVELLHCRDEVRAGELARYLDGLNQSRRKLENDVTREAAAQITEKFDSTDAAYVLAGDWHRGVIGLAAGRLAQQYNRPVILISIDPKGTVPGCGSARSVTGIHLYEALRSCYEMSVLERFGGHAAAAGLGVANDKIDEFRAMFCDFVASHRKDTDGLAELVIDGEFPLSAFSMSTLHEIERLAPFGMANPNPLFCAKAVRLKSNSIREMGVEKNHFSCRLVDGSGAEHHAVAFHCKPWIDELRDLNECPLDVVFRAQKNVYRDRAQVQLRLEDWRRTE